MSMPSQLEQLEATLKEAISRAIQANALSGAVPDSIKLERPKERSHGDYATSIALQISKAMGRNPREVAQVIADQLIGIDSINKVEIAGPGFINLTLNRASQAQLVETIVAAKDSFGQGKSLSGIKINLEFISANPTGPLHLGHTRWAAVGDALGRVLAAAGAQVTREFYINDRGNQMDLFGQSVEAVALGQPIPENGYQGDYIKDLAKEVVMENAGIKELSSANRTDAFREAAYKVQLKDQQRVLDSFNTHFDVWFSERSLHDQGAVEHGVQRLRKQGHVFENEGAIWLRTTDFGDDKE